MTPIAIAEALCVGSKPTVVHSWRLLPASGASWFIIGALVGLTAAILSRLNVPVVRGAKLGWMSEQWLDEHRASRET